MAVLIALSAISSFAAGAIAGILGVLSVAIRREDRNLSLTSEATDHVTRAGRWLNGVGVHAPLHPVTIKYADVIESLYATAAKAGWGICPNR